MAVLILLLWITIFSIVTYLIIRLTKHLNVLIHLRKLCGPPGTSLLFGNCYPLLTTPEGLFKILREWGKNYYPNYSLWLAYLGSANLLSPDDMELILSNTSHIKKSPLYNLLHNWLGTGLLTSTGSKWQIRRKILTPGFHFNILRGFISIFNEETEALVEVLKKECRIKLSVNVTPHIAQFTLKTIAETSMGTKLKFDTKAEKDYKHAIKEITDIYLYRLMRPWLGNNFVNFFTISGFKEMGFIKTLHEFTTKVIAERRRNFKGIPALSEEDSTYSSRKKLAMLDLLLSAQLDEGIIDNQGVREEVDTFMFEGHDTTAVAISYILMLLACNKDAQEKILQEMEEVLGDVHKKPDYNDLQELKYLERCIKESLRLYPSVPFISRELGEDLVTSNGYKLLKGSIVHLHIFDLHYNPDIYPEPEKFDPDRFLPENCQNRHPFAYIPFSAGPRNCIGQRFALLELKAAVCGILANFSLEPVDTPKTIEIIADLVLRTKNGIRVKFVSRR